VVLTSIFFCNCACCHFTCIEGELIWSIYCWRKEKVINSSTIKEVNNSQEILMLKSTEKSVVLYNDYETKFYLWTRRIKLGYERTRLSTIRWSTNIENKNKKSFTINGNIYKFYLIIRITHAKIPEKINDRSKYKSLTRMLISAFR
jgi:hypothetical protein